jgi:hypothetical protein
VKEGSYDSGHHGETYISPGSLSVDGVLVNASAKREILNGYERIQRRVKAAKAVADRAQEDMKKNEAAWNLAEKLLGMKRNEFGALVPITTANEEKPNADQHEKETTSRAGCGKSRSAVTSELCQIAG